jgi:hypothetical protein
LYYFLKPETVYFIKFILAMQILPRRMFLLIVLAFASVGRTDAQLIQSLFNFLSTLDFNALLTSLCPVISPVLTGFGISLPQCNTGAPTPSGPNPAPAPTPKAPKKITSTVSAPVAPPAAAP